MDPHANLSHSLSEQSDLPSRDREVLKLAIRSLLMVHCKQHDPGALPRLDRGTTPKRPSH